MLSHIWNNKCLKYLLSDLASILNYYLLSEICLISFINNSNNKHSQYLKNAQDMIIMKTKDKIIWELFIPHICWHWHKNIAHLSAVTAAAKLQMKVLVL